VAVFYHPLGSGILTAAMSLLYELKRRNVLRVAAGKLDRMIRVVLAVTD